MGIGMEGVIAKKVREGQEQTNQRLDAVIGRLDKLIDAVNKNTAWMATQTAKQN